MEIEEVRKKLRDIIFNGLPDECEFCMQPDSDLFVIMDGVCFQIEMHLVPEWKAPECKPSTPKN